MPRRLGASDGPSRRFDNFTNRAIELAAIERVLRVPAGSPLPVVMFWGVGGSGKSWLLRKVRDDLPPGLPSALLDLEPNAGGTPYHTDSARALGELRRQFVDVPFPRFDLAYAWLRYKEGVRDEPLLRGSGPTAAVFELLTDVVPGMAEGIPGVSWLVRQMTKRASRRLKDSALETWLAEKVGQEDFQRLRHAHPQDLYPALADRFLIDAAEHLPGRGDSACRGVLFLDTFEALRLGVSGNAAALQREQWVRSLVALDSPLLVVIAGRDRVDWESVDPDFAEDWCLQQHLVGGLSDADARRYLSSCGIADQRLQDAVLQVSLDSDKDDPVREGAHHPFSLGLCADTILGESARGVAADPSTFSMTAGDTAALGQRFLRSLNDATFETWIRRLAATPRFDEHAARTSFSPAGGAPQDAAWQMLRGYSFVRETDDPRWITLHAIMRTAIASGSASSEHHRFWEAEWSRRSVSDTDEFAALAWFHRYSLEPRAATDEWGRLAVSLRHDMRMADHHALLGWWDPIDLVGASNHSPHRARGLFVLGIEHWYSTIGDRAANLSNAISCNRAALLDYTEHDFPKEWAITHTNLGLAFQSLPGGDRPANLTKAIDHFQQSLRVLNEDDFPSQWANTQNNLGVAQATRPGGDRSSNLTEAIASYQNSLRVFSETDYPDDWALVQFNLGDAYQSLPTGEQKENIGRAIECYRNALRVWSETDFPHDWACTQSSLGNAFTMLPGGDRSASIATAIACYGDALRVLAESDFPRDRAMVKHNLGVAYQTMPGGDRSGNINTAIAHYREALQVLTQRDFPRDWAAAQLNLGNAHCFLPSDEHEADLDTAIASFTSALGVFTETEFPQEWAATQHSLGCARALMTGEDDQNLSEAIAHFSQAMRVQTEDAYPFDWSVTQHNLGVVLAATPGATNENRSLAAACFANALRGFIAVGFADERAATERNLARIKDPPVQMQGAGRVSIDRLLRQLPVHVYRG